MKLKKLFKLSLLLSLVLVIVFSGSSILQKFEPKETSAAATFISSAKNNSKSSGTTLTLTVPAGGWAAGSSVIITAAYDGMCREFVNQPNRISSITDSAGNTYTSDIIYEAPEIWQCFSAPPTLINHIWSAHNINALSAGNTITINWYENITARAAVASNFTGLLTSGTYAGGQGAASASGTAASTTFNVTQANTLVVAAISVEGPLGDTFGSDATYGLVDRSGTTGGSATSNMTDSIQYKIAPSSGSNSATGTLGTSRAWIALAATYKIAGPPPTIAFVSSTKNTSKISGNTLTLTVPAGGWASGSSVIVTVTYDTAVFDISCIYPTVTDSAGNTYNYDEQKMNITSQVNCNATFGATVFSAHNISALSSGSTITITFVGGNITAKAAVAANFTGLAPIGAVDRAQAHCGPGVDPVNSGDQCSGASTNTFADSWGSSSTTQADELLIGLIGPEGPLGDSFSADLNYALIDRAGTTGGSATGNITNNAEYRIVSSTGSQRATGTLSPGRNWMALMVSYKALLPPPTLSLSHYRWRDDSTALNTSGGFLANQDAAYTSVTVGSTTRLRVQVKNTSANPASGHQYRLEYARKLGSSCGTFAAVPTSAGYPFQMVGSAQYTNNDAVTGNLLTDPGLAFFSGYGIENPYNLTPANTVPGNNYTELEYAIKAAASSSAGGPYCFRVTNNGYAGDFSYSYYPELKISWPANWLYYQPVSVTNNVASVLTNYEIKLTVNTQALIAAGKLQSQCQDLRFVDTDGISRLAYFLETADCNSAATTVWIKVPSIPASGATTVYMYYGNTSAVSEASGDETFAFFDNFESGTLSSNKWSVSGGSELVDTAQKRYGTYSLKILPFPIILDSVSVPASIATKGIFEAYVRYNETNRYHYAFNLRLNTGVESYSTVAAMTYWSRFNTINGWLTYSPLTAYSAGTWYLAAAKYDFSDTTANPNGTYWPVINGTQLSATPLLDYNNNPGTSMLRWTMFEDSGGGTFWVDDVRMRHYASIEPTVALLNVPTLTSPTSTAVTNNSATLGATVSSDGGSALTARGTCWDIIPAPITNCSPEGGTSVGLFTMSVTGLPQSTLIYYRGYATSASGTGYSPDGTFITGGAPSAPILTSPTVSSITDTTATLGATIMSDGGALITARGTCWGTSAAPLTNCVPEGGTATGVFIQARASLTPGSLIYYRGYATNSIGTDYSPDGTFTTLALPTVTSPTAGSITSTTATLGANVTSDGGTSLTARGTCWDTVSPVTAHCLSGGTTTGIFTQARTNLPVNTLIYYRGYAVNSVGTAYSPEGTFNTSASSANGILTSIVFDTGVFPAYNAILWKGTLPAGTKVRFRLAASNSPLGPWNDSDFIGGNGTSCGSAYWYEPSTPNLPLQLGCQSSFNSKRYFKYKVQLCSATDCITQGTETPVVTDIVINWSP